MKLLLHACCGPCSLEPLRLLLEAGHSIDIAYMNSNIHPAQEYEHRRETLLDFAQSQGINVVEGAYDPQEWANQVGVFGTDPAMHEQRCRACYRLRLREVAQYAADHGFDGIATTLTVSPYQYTQVIAEECKAAADEFGLQSVFEDFRPQYPQATKHSKELGMYRQNYCGCAFSKIEAAEEREERKRMREQQKAEKAAAEAPKRAAEEAARQANRAEKKAYANKRAAQKAALKAYKQAHRAESQETKAE